MFSLIRRPSWSPDFSNGHYEQIKDEKSTMPFRIYSCGYNNRTLLPSILHSWIVALFPLLMGFTSVLAQAAELNSDVDLQEGKRTFSIYCTQCHGIGGAGGGHSRNGPNLTDSISIYGGKLSDIIQVISEGVPRAAMPQWKHKMAPERIRKVAVYVHSIKATQNIAESTSQIPAQIQNINTSDSLKEGKRKFRIHCAQCHGLSGTGGVGPNLTDQHTIHGSAFQDIVTIITYGAPNKLMPPWGEKLGMDGVKQLAVYVSSLKETTTTNAQSTSELTREEILNNSDFQQMIEAGRRSFNSHCVECHGSDGKGGAGPNLTDEFTLHGQELTNITNVITNGVTGLMPRWGQKMSGDRIAQFAAYVYSITGSRPTGKPPEKRVSRLLNSRYIQTDKKKEDHSDGRRTFVIYCEQCHGMGGLGGAGPNLTDEFTLHGDKLSDIITVITNGVPAMQMPTWGQVMTTERISKVANYVHSLMGSRPTGKLPESNRPENLRGTSPFR